MKLESQLELDWAQAQNLVDALIFSVTHKHLGNAEVQVLRGAWDGKTYETIASEAHLPVKYIGEVGGKLWHNLSNALGEEVKKTNFRFGLVQLHSNSAVPRYQIYRLYFRERLGS